MATVAELRATAKAKGLKGYSKLNKQQLEGLIIRHNLEVQKAQREQQETPAEAAPVISTDTQSVSAPEIKEETAIVLPEGVYGITPEGNYILHPDKIHNVWTPKQYEHRQAMNALYRQLMDCKTDEEIISILKPLTKKLIHEVNIRFSDPKGLYYVDTRIHTKAEMIKRTMFVIQANQAKTRKAEFVPEALQPAPVQEANTMTPAEEKHEICKQFCNCEMSPDEFRAMLNGFSMDGINDYLNHLIYFYRPENFTYRNAVDFLIESYIPIWEKDQARIKAHEAYQAKQAEKKANTTTAPATTPDYDTAFDECAYSPDFQYNRAVFDDEPLPRLFRPAKRKLTTGRKLPTPKYRHGQGIVADFSPCKDAETLRKLLNAGSVENLKVIAESFVEFQPRPDGGKMDKKFYVTAIIKLYFPDYQLETAPAQKAKLDLYGKPINQQYGNKFIPGKIYVEGSLNYHNEPNPEPQLIRVIRRKNDTVTVQVVSYPDFQPIFKPVSKKVKQHLHYRKHQETFALYESITLPNSHDIDGVDMWICSLCEYNAMIIDTPSYDVDFDETAYSPDVQDISVIVDDIPADHEPDIVPASEPEPQQAKIICFDYDDLLNDDWIDAHYDEICNHNAALLENCTTAEEMRALLDGVNKCTMNFTMQRIADFHGTTGSYYWGYGKTVTYTHEEMVQKLIDRVLYCREDKLKHEASTEPRKSAPKPDTTPAKTSTKFPRLERCPHCGSIHKPYFSYRKQNNYSYTRQHFGSDPSEWTIATLKCRDCGHTIEEYFGALYGQPFPSRQEAMKKVIGTWCLKSSMADRTTWKFKPEPIPCVYISNIQPQTEHQSAPAEFAPVSKSAPKPATRNPRNVKKIYDGRQLLIYFDDAETPATVQPAKPKTRRVSRPRIKRDYTRQLLIDFGEDITDGQTDQRKTA